jgi:N-acetylneuraminate synthase
VSTAGLRLQQIDRLVSFFESRQMRFALMHCVALYPTPDDKLQLNHITMLRERYPHIPVGFSTHEDPDDDMPIRIAVAKGAQLFERHVGLATEQYALNKYSATPQQVRKWIAGYKSAVEMCGGDHWSPAPVEELASLRSLMRGVYAKEAIQEGERLTREKIFFAMPLQEGQLCSGDWVDDLETDTLYAVNAPISERVANFQPSQDDLIYRIMLEVRGMLNEARIPLSEESSIELSHHYGLERFREFGAVIIDCINREYCKKLIILLPRQKHPYHFHKKKEETFQLLYGDLEVEKNGLQMRLNLGDTVLVEAEKWHKFHTLHGAIFEEISTTHFNNDSYYEDKRIARLPREARKTSISTWKDIIQR